MHDAMSGAPKVSALHESGSDDAAHLSSSPSAPTQAESPQHALIFAWHELARHWPHAVASAPSKRHVVEKEDGLSLTMKMHDTSIAPMRTNDTRRTAACTCYCRMLGALARVT
jgi:hypothetical protein